MSAPATTARPGCDTCVGGKATHKARVYLHAESDDCETLNVCCNCNNCDDDCEEREPVRYDPMYDSAYGGDGPED